MTASPQRVLIAGGGTAGWMAAAALARFVGPTGVQIELVESEQIGTVGVGEATIPNIADFNAMLGIEEHDFLAATRGTYKLGIAFENWGRPGDHYFHPFGTYGLDLGGQPFHQIWHAQRQTVGSPPLDAFSMCAQAALSGKFMQPHSDPQSPVSQLRHAYHFDAGLYARFLRRRAENQGVVRHEGRIATVEQAPETGDLVALVLEDGRRLDADFFIDCTGFRSLLLGQTLNVPFEDWSHWLPCDRAIAVPSARTEPLRPFTRARAGQAGWQWRIPLQHRTGNGHVYCSAARDDETALLELLAGLDGEVLGEPNHLRFTTGRRSRLWEKNCVALGLAAGFLEPLESTSIHLIQEGISKLLALFPDVQGNLAETGMYNRLMIESFDVIRDFIILHYAANQREDNAFWRGLREMVLPDRLQSILDVFHRHGRLFVHDRDLFTLTSWVAVLYGQNIQPGAADPLARAIPPAERAQFLGNLEHVYARAAQHMPPHTAYLNQFCSSPSAETS